MKMILRAIFVFIALFVSTQNSMAAYPCYTELEADNRTGAGTYTKAQADAEYDRLSESEMRQMLVNHADRLQYSQSPNEINWLQCEIKNLKIRLNSKTSNQTQTNLAGLWGVNDCLDGADLVAPKSTGGYEVYSCSAEGCEGPFGLEVTKKFAMEHHVKCSNVTDPQKALQFVRTHLSSSAKTSAPKTAASSQQQRDGEDATRCLKLTSNSDGNAIANACNQRVRYYFCGLDAGGSDRGAGVGVCPDIGGSELNPGQIKNLTQARSKTRYFYGGCFTPWVPMSGKFTGDRIVGMHCFRP